MIDANALTGSHLAIIGNSGSGKSYAIRRLLEDSWGQAVHVVFDCEDEFHTLRADRPYVLVGGDHADLPLHLSDAAALARRVVSSQISVIIQLNDLAMADRQRYIARFLEAMMGLRRPDWRRVMVVIDEADKYVPQTGQVESSTPIVALMAQGRKRGFIGVLATQRAAKISKNAVAECANWMIGRVGAQNDRRVAADTLGFKVTSPEMEGLRCLGAGQFWTLGPAFGERALIQVPRARTQHLAFGQSWTPPAIDPCYAQSLVPPAMRPYEAPARARPGFSRHLVTAAVWGLGIGIPMGAVALIRHMLSGFL